jgi:uncharacterized membrane protein/glutaredoxin
LIQVLLYSRPGCHLCDEVSDLLDDLRPEYPHQVQIIDIDQDPKLQKAYADRVPVVQIGPYQLQAPITRDQLVITLGAALDREKHAAAIDDATLGGSTATQLSTGERFSLWITQHYLAVFNFVIFIYLGLPFLAPILMKNNITKPAHVIYSGYSFMCHQLAFRSMFLFGEQVVYPRSTAGVDNLFPYESATGNNPEDLLAAREFVGNEVVGYKVALCERDIAIYAGILTFGLLFAITGRKIPPLPWYLWIVLGILPIGLDGFTQLLSQLGIPFINAVIPYRESTPMLRYLTGFLFGLSTAWFGYPLVESSMRDTRQILERKLKRIQANQQSAKPAAE